MAATLVNVEGAWPDGTPVDVRVLLLGDWHTPPRSTPVGDVTVMDLLWGASSRAARLRCCLDVVLEDPERRAIVKDSKGRVRQYKPGQGYHEDTLTSLRLDLRPCLPRPAELKGGGSTPCPLLLTRVHAFDTRPAVTGTADRAHRRMRQVYGKRMYQPLDRYGKAPPVSREEWLFFFMCLDADGVARGPIAPSPMIEQVMMSRLFDSNREAMARWLYEHARTARRIQKRAAKLGERRAQMLADLVVMEAGEGRSISDYETDATDYYALLRILAPYADKDRAPCGAGIAGARQSRVVILYAGDHHTRHIYRVLCSLVAADWPDIPHMQPSKRVPMKQLEVRGPNLEPCTTGADLLRQLLPE